MHSQANEVFGLANDALKASGAAYWIDCGTLLGAVREGDFLAHDTDIDFSVWSPDHHEDIAAEFAARGFTTHFIHGTPERGYQQTFKQHGIKVDVFYFYPGFPDRDVEGRCWQGSWWKIHHLIVSKFFTDDILPLRTTTFKGQEIPIPQRPKRLLRARYDTWRVPNKFWDWAHDPPCIDPETLPPTLKGRQMRARRDKPGPERWPIPPIGPLSTPDELDDTTILIKTFDRDGYLFRLVDSIRSRYPDVPIIVADDGRPNPERDEFLQGTTHLKLPYDSGLSRGRNAALDACETEFFVVLDDDSFITEEARLGDLVSLLDVADIAAGKQVECSVRDASGHYEGYLIRDEDVLRMTYLDPEWRTHQGILYCPTELALNIFAARTEAIQTFRWDDEFKIGYEHLDFFLRCKNEGLRVVYAPWSRVHHRPKGVTSSPTYMKYRRRVRSSRDHFFNKHHLGAVMNFSGGLDTR